MYSGKMNKRLSAVLKTRVTETAQLCQKNLSMHHLLFTITVYSIDRIIIHGPFLNQVGILSERKLVSIKDVVW